MSEYKCIVCGVDMDDTNRFYKVKRLCNKHYLQKRKRGEEMEDFPLPPKIDPNELIGQRFGMLTVLEVADDSYVKNYIGNNVRKIKYRCLCDCGNEKIILRENLKYTHTQSCGCYQRKRASETGKKSLVGESFGLLTVIDFADPYISPEGKKLTKYKCKCVCGTEKEIFGCHLSKGNIISCGCMKPAITAEVHTKNILGQKFGRLTVEEMLPNYEGKKYPKTYWRCRCDCGNEVITYTSTLTTGNTQSCGCKKESKGEKKISQYLKDNNIEFESEKTFDGLVGEKGWKLRVDFYLKDYNLVIEYQGVQHYVMRSFSGNSEFDEENFHLQRRNDQRKRDYFKEHNIDLLEIPYAKQYKMFDMINERLIQ